MKTTHKILSSVFLCLGSLAVSNSVFAGGITSCSGGSGDYGDAPTEYGVACHDTNRWQQLGTDGYNGDTLKGDSIGIDDYNNIGWSSESSSNSVDTGDNGIMWSVSSDGQNWSSFGTTADLTQGQYVKFKVDAKRSTEGNHKFDEYKLWLDWYGDNSFDNGTSDVVFKDKWWKNEDADGNEFVGSRANNYYNNDLNAFNSPVEFATFISDAIMVPLDALLGQTWLRARFVCENSYTGPLKATGYYHQGETEDYSINIVQDVNAPATIALFSLAIFGMVSRIRQSS